MAKVQYSYDVNGNMVTRNSDELAYDPEGHLLSYTRGGTTLAEYTYDGDGKRVKAVVNGVSTYYIGNYFKWEYKPTPPPATTNKVSYYFAGTQRIAMRKNSDSRIYLLSDHLGSVLTTYPAPGSPMKYNAYGAVYSANGTNTLTPDTYTYTGQKVEDAIGLMYYNARWYDSSLGRFISPDTIIPDPLNPVSWDRYLSVRSF